MIKKSTFYLIQGNSKMKSLKQYANLKFLEQGNTKRNLKRALRAGTERNNGLKEALPEDF